MLQGVSPDREQTEPHLQRPSGEKRKELVIDCASPNTKLVSLNTKRGLPEYPKPATKSLFGDSLIALKGPAKPTAAFSSGRVENR